jgi:hypothetical protein
LGGVDDGGKVGVGGVGGVGQGGCRKLDAQMLPESSSSQVTVGSWIARMEERGMQGVEERSWGEFARDRVERQQFRQEELVPRIVDVCIVVRGLRVFIDSSSSPRMGPAVQGGLLRDLARRCKG